MDPQGRAGGLGCGVLTRDQPSTNAACNTAQVGYPSKSPGGATAKAPTQLPMAKLRPPKTLQTAGDDAGRESVAGSHGVHDVLYLHARHVDPVVPPLREGAARASFDDQYLASVQQAGFEQLLWVVGAPQLSQLLLGRTNHRPQAQEGFERFSPGDRVAELEPEVQIQRWYAPRAASVRASVTAESRGECPTIGVMPDVCSQRALSGRGHAAGSYAHRDPALSWR